MKQLTRILMVGVMIALLGLLAASVAAQGGEGGIVIAPNFGDDPATMNPLLVNDTSSSLVEERIFIDIIEVDPDTGNYAPGAPGGMATDWTISDDGLVYTFTLRDDFFWTDGTPITAADYVYTWQALESGETSSPRTEAADRIALVEAPDAQTLVITFEESSCNNIDQIDDFGILPSHVFMDLIGEDFALLDDLDFNLNPTVTAGVFSFGEFRPGEQVSMIANQDYPDAQLGYVSPTGFVYQVVPDLNVLAERFLAGDLTVSMNADDAGGLPRERYAEVRERAAAGEFQTFEQPSNGYSWLAWNAANPANPLPGLDDDGNVVEQDPHPILGDARVRRALSMSLNVNDVIDSAIFGEGTRVATHSIPTSWAYNPDVPLVEFDPEGALDLLAEAGWVDDDDDPSTPLVATEDALYAEPGTEFRIEIITNAGNTEREAIGTIAQDQFGQIGIVVDFNIIDFNVAVERLLAQDIDGAILGWSLSTPDDPDFGFAFNPENDVPGAGFNFTSYYNAEVTALLDEGNNLAGCDQAARAALYGQAQALLAEDQPYTFLFSANVLMAAQSNVDGFDPAANFGFWNVDAWTIAP